MALLGLWGIVQHPAVLWALNPAVGLRYLFGGGATALPALGGVFLCATGAEVLYADMGHFGRLPIRLVWSCLVFPALLLNYAGQAAIVLAGTPTEGSIFFRLCPPPLLLPLVLLATSACASSFSRLARRSLALRPAHSRCHQFVTRIPKASAISSPP